MRKLVKLLTITTIASTSVLQVTACKDDSKFDSFMSDVNNSIRDNSAFFGFLGSADNEISKALQDSIDTFNSVPTTDNLSWQKWVDSRSNELSHPKLQLTNIHLSYYQGPYHQDKPSDITDSFWNDKSISWQKNIFNWIYSHTKDNKDFKTPKEGAGVSEIKTKKDASDNDMFTDLPIVFIVSKGKLITAGQNWIAASSSVAQQFDALTQFILDNLLSISN